MVLRKNVFGLFLNRKKKTSKEKSLCTGNTASGYEIGYRAGVRGQEPGYKK
jgi:hypothetical protein